MDKLYIKSVDQYIDMQTQSVQGILRKLQSLSKSASKDLVETISYQMPTYKLKKNLIHFAAFSQHIGVYPGPKAMIVFASKLSNYKTGKGSIQIPLNQPFPYDLYEQILKYLIEENK